MSTTEHSSRRDREANDNVTFPFSYRERHNKKRAPTSANTRRLPATVINSRGELEFVDFSTVVARARL